MNFIKGQKISNNLKFGIVLANYWQNDL